MMNKRIGKPFRASACTVVVLIGACLLHEAWCKSDGIPPCNDNFEDTNIVSWKPDDVEKKLERIERWNSNAMIGDRSVKELLQYRNIACDLKDPDLLVSRYASCRDGKRVNTNQGIIVFVASKIAGRKQSCVKQILPIMNNINSHLPADQMKLFTASEQVKEERLYEGASAIGSAAQTVLGQWSLESDWETAKKQAHQACLDYETTWSNLVVRKNLEGLANSDPTIRHWWNVELICGYLRAKYGSITQQVKSASQPSNLVKPRFMSNNRQPDVRKPDNRQSAISQSASGQSINKQSANKQSDRSVFMACDKNFNNFNSWFLTPEIAVEKLEALREQNPWIGNRRVDELLQYKNTECDLKDPDFLVSKYATCQQENSYITNVGIINYIASMIAGRKQSCVKQILPIINNINSHLPADQMKLFTASEQVKEERLYEGGSAVGPAAQSVLGQWSLESDWETSKKQARQACIDYETTWSNLIIRKNLEGLADSDPTVRHWWNVELTCGYIRSKYETITQQAMKDSKSDNRQSASRQSVNKQSDRSGLMTCDNNFNYFNHWSLAPQIAEDKLEELREKNPWIGNRRVEELLQYKNTKCDLRDPDFLKSKYATCKQGDSYITNQGIINFIASKIAGRRKSCLEVIPPIVERAFATLSDNNYLQLRKIFIQDELTFFQGSSAIRKAVDSASPRKWYGSQKKSKRLDEACVEYESINSKLEVARENLQGLADHNLTVRRWWNLEFICNHIKSA